MDESFFNFQVALACIDFRFHVKQINFKLLSSTMMWDLNYYFMYFMIIIRFISKIMI